MHDEVKINVVKKSACPCCGSLGISLHNHLKDRLFKTPGIWSMSKCSNKSCGLLWLDPAPVSSDLHFAYQNYYTHSVPKNKKLSLFRRIVRGYQALRFGYLVNETSSSYQVLGLLFSSLGFIREHMNFPFVYFKNQAKGRLLELGVGSGANLKRFIDWGWQAEGLDFDPKAVDACKALGLKVMNGDLMSQNFNGGSYDAIFSSHVLEHVPDPTLILEESFRVLGDGGVFVAVTPNANSILHCIFKRSWRGLEPPRHLHIFTYQALKKLAVSSGFKRVEVYSSNLSSGEIFMYSLVLKFKIRPTFILKIISSFARIGLNLYRIFIPMSGEELILVAYK